MQVNACLNLNLLILNRLLLFGLTKEVGRSPLVSLTVLSTLSYLLLNHFLWIWEHFLGPLT